MKRYKIAALSLVVASSLSACSSGSNNSNNKAAPSNEPQNNTGQASTLKPSNTQSTIKNVTVEDAKKLLGEHKDLIVFDVRTEEEYKSGHLNNAILIPHDQIINRFSEIEKYKDKQVLVYCRTGNRSAVTVQTLEKKGFKNIYHMNEGITAWKYDLVK